jgi:catechol 2,3-dioxygenase-like lactoylglutathione lyase family enzyme
MSEKIEFLSAVSIRSREPARLVRFYRDVLGLPLEEQHEGAEARWGCTLGEVHLGIHGADEPATTAPSPSGAISLAFAVADVDEIAAALEAQGLELEFSPRDLGWCKLTAVRDPDGNYVELSELGADWFRHLEKRHDQGRGRPRARKRETPRRS